MKPDFEDKGIRFFNMDCMDFMADKPDNYYSLSITDPPYGGKDAINPASSRNKYVAERKIYKVFDNVKPKNKYFEELKRVSKNQIVWGGNNFGLTGGVIVWQKNGTAFGEGEVAICSTHKSVKFFEWTWNGMIQQDMSNKEQRIHPTQKPVALYRWLLKNYAKLGDRILDTHGGSMSSAIACALDGFEMDIIEIDADYFNSAIKRFKEQTCQMQLFQTSA